MNGIASAYIAACRLELDALKPGNVHRFADGHGMSVMDFEVSAQVSAPGLCRNGVAVGERVYDAVSATIAAVGQNTNLGIVLLCAPLCKAAESKAPLRTALRSVLSDLTIFDAQRAFAAIALANPGGLGSVPQHDVRSHASTTLITAMMAASARDLVARQYATEFQDIFETGLGTWREARGAGKSPSEAATDVFLGFLQAYDDTHIARKFGIAAAQAVRADAEARMRRLPTQPDRQRNLLMEWDRDLKLQGLNPGACADLTVATLFVSHLLELPPNALQVHDNGD